MPVLAVHVWGCGHTTPAAQPALLRLPRAGAGQSGPRGAPAGRRLGGLPACRKHARTHDVMAAAGGLLAWFGLLHERVGGC